MPGTRTAPATSATVTGTQATLHLVDASGDQITDSLQVAGAVTAANVETWGAAYQLATNASLWKISITQEWEGDLDPDNAIAAYRASVKEGINLAMKNLTTLKSQTPRIVAPIDTIMQGNQDIPNLNPQVAIDVIAAYLAILTGYSVQSAQFTGRRERRNNPRIKV